MIYIIHTFDNLKWIKNRVTSKGIDGRVSFPIRECEEQDAKKKWPLKRGAISGTENK